MLERIDLSKKRMSKEEFKPRYDELIQELVILQQQARAKDIGLVVLFEGWDGSGKGSRISDLMYNLDARATTVHVTENFDAEAARRFAGAELGVTGFNPIMKEFWESLGMRGTVTFYDRGWYTLAAQQMLYKELPKGKRTKKEIRKLREAKKNNDASAAFSAREGVYPSVFDYHLASCAEFEQQLVDDGYIVVKFFLHISKEEQMSRLMKLFENEDTRWRVSNSKLTAFGNYNQAYELYDALLEGSDFSFAPWHVLNAEDKRATNLAIAKTLVKELRKAVDAEVDAAAAAAAAKAQANSAGKGEEVSIFDRTPEQEAAVRVQAEEEARAASERAPRTSRFAIESKPPTLEGVRYDLVLDRVDYKKQLKAEQKRFAALELEMYQRRLPLVVMYEGWDAAGKGGAIKRLAQALDARAYTIFTSPAPTRPELMHPHLWRYWTRLPRAGHVGIYDRSWYGRVLVERVEGFASDEEWARAYDEINAFESELIKWGAVVVKFWVDVSPDEQLNRFTERQNNPAKIWKITDEDWRNRDKYPQYKAAVEDMFRLTSTEFAPWHIIESDNKYYARVKSLKIVNDALEARLREKK